MNSETLDIVLVLQDAHGTLAHQTGCIRGSPCCSRSALCGQALTRYILG